MKTNILGCYISNLVSYNDAYNKLLSYSLKNLPGYITVNNVHTVIEGVKSSHYKQIINDAFNGFAGRQTAFCNCKAER